MKKLFIATTAILVFMLCSCSGRSAKTEETTPEPGIELGYTEDDADDLEPIEENVSCDSVFSFDSKSIEMVRIGRTAKINDEIYISLNVYVPADSKSVIGHIAADVDSTYYMISDSRVVLNESVTNVGELSDEFDMICRNFTDSIAPDILESDYPIKAYSVVISQVPVFAWDKYITYSSYYEYYSGGAHPMYDHSYYTIDSETGEIYDFNTLVEKRYQPSVRKALVETIARAEEKSVEEYLASVADFASSGNEPLTVDNFPIYSVAIGQEGLLFSYPPYSIGPYAAGNPTYALPIESVKGTLTIKVN